MAIFQKNRAPNETLSAKFRQTLKVLGFLLIYIDKKMNFFFQMKKIKNSIIFEQKKKRFLKD